MRIDLLLSQPFAKDDEKPEEPYFSTKYKEEPIPPLYMQKWETFQDIDPALHLPQLNRFMPETSFWRNDLENEESQSADHDMEADDDEYQDLEEMEADDMEADDDEYQDLEEMDSFQPIGVDAYNKLFYQYEDALLSTASFKIYMDVSGEATSHMVSRICFELLKDQLSPILYEGEEAYISSQLSFGDDSTIELKLDGYAASFRHFLSTVWEAFSSFVPSPEAFESITEKMRRQFYLTSRDLNVHALHLLSESIIEGQLSMHEKFNALKLITYDDLRAFLPKMQQIRIVGVFTGRYSVDDCKQILGLFKPTGRFEIRRELATKKHLPLNSPYRVSAKPITENNSNSLVKVYYQMSGERNSSDFNPNKLSAFLHLLKSMLDKKIYSTYRIKQTLGYDGGCEIHKHHGIEGIYFYVISCDHKPETLLEKLYEFVAEIHQYLDKVDEKTFELYKSGTDVADDSGMSRDLVHDDSCVFGRHTAVREALKKMKKKDMIKMYKHFFSQKSSIVEVVISSEV